MGMGMSGERQMTRDGGTYTEAVARDELPLEAVGIVREAELPDAIEQSDEEQELAIEKRGRTQYCRVVPP